MYNELKNQKDSDFLYYLKKPEDISSTKRSRLIKDYIEMMNVHF